MRNSLTLPVYVPTLILAFAGGLLIPIMPLYAASFDVSYGLIGLVLASQGLGTLVGDVPAGILLGRLGQRRSMLIGIGCKGLAMLAMGWAHAFPELVIYGLIAGVGGALWNISLHAYLTDIVPLDRRGRTIAVFGGIGRIGIFAGPLIGGTVAAGFGLRAPFFLSAALVLIAMTMPAFFVKDSAPDGSRRRIGWKGHTGHLVAVLREHRRVLLSAGSGQIFAQTIRSGRQIIVPLFAADVIGLDVQAIGWIITLSAAVDMSLFYPAGLLMDRYGRKYAYVPSFIIQAIGMGLIPFSSSFLGLLLATSVLGFGNGIGSGTMMTLGADLAPKESMGEFLGIWRLIGDVGQTGGPIVVGNVADLLGLSTATFAIAAFGLLAAMTLGLLVPETLKPSVAIPKADP